MNLSNEVSVLKLSLHGQLVGYLTGAKNGRNVISFADEFKNNIARPTFSLITQPNFPNASKSLSKTWQTKQKLHPILSNLLPEGVLREIIAQNLNEHVDNEFPLFASLGHDLPGALIATPVEPANVPDYVLSNLINNKIVPVSIRKNQNKFSLAGIQLKFSMKEKDGRYNINFDDKLGDWIIKTPSTKHEFVPLNEYSAMSLAEMVGINIPEIKLVNLNLLDNLPQINLPNEEFAFAIKRFDRDNNTRIHMEDFAQVLVKYPHQKYNSASYQQIAKVLYDYSGDGLADLQQFSRRLLVNILLANGDAHLKNWSLLYQDQITPRLSPAYDILTTSVFIDNESTLALNLAKNKNWFNINYEDFKSLTIKAGAPWRAIKPHLDDVMQRARELWPQALKDLPMTYLHKQKLTQHWQNIHSDFQIKL